MPTSPLKAIESIQSDPLFYLRVACAERNQTGLYLIELPKKMVGFSCYLDESEVPGTEAQKKLQRLAEEKLEELNNFESEAFQRSDNDRGE